MDPRQRGPIGLVIVAILIGACGAAGSPSPSAVGIAGIPATAEPSASSFGPDPSLAAAGADAAATAAPAQDATPAPVSTPAAKPVPAATPAPTPRPVAVATAWTRPRQIGTLKTCSTVSAGIDTASRYHVVAECAGSIHYYESTDGRSWAGTVFAHPAHREDLDPKIAFRGDVVYVAFSRIAPDGGCSGTRGVDVGVYFRKRAQPGAAWSAPVRLGSGPDSLRSFRVEGDTIHAITQNAQVGRMYYETLTGTTFHRYRLPAYSDVSLRIGSDGRARIAYFGEGGLRLATFTGSGFSTAAVRTSSPGGDAYDSFPVLALGGGDRAHLVWTRREMAACGPGSGVGTYYATNASGTWRSERVTKDVGVTSLQVDTATGRVHVLVGGEKNGVLYCTKSPTGAWVRTKIAATKGATDLAIRLDPATGTLLAVYLAGGWGPGEIYVVMKS